MEELALKGFLRKKIVPRIMPLLKQGISPEKIALAMAMGAAIGICPLIGATTAMCVVAALVLRLNQPAIQIANYLVYPLQIILLIPFFQFGAWIFGMAPLPLSAPHLIFMFHENFWQTVKTLWRIIFHAIVAWGLICPPTIAVLYYILSPLIRRMKAGQGTTPES